MKETILSLEKGAMERWRNGDPWGWVEISAEDVTYVDPSLTRPILGLEEYKAYLKGRVTNQTLWNTTEVYFRLGGKWSIAHTHWSYVEHKLPESVTVSIPVQLSPKEYDGVLGQVMALESAAMERWRKGDPWGFTEISRPDVTYFDTGTPQRLNGLDALKTLYAEWEGEIHYDVMEFIDPRIQIHGDMVVLTYRFFSTQLTPDGSISSRTPWNCSEVFVRIEGQWSIIHTHWSYIKGERT
jgi:hypothetical protein